MNDLQQIFKNAPLDKEGNTLKSWSDFFQYRCLVLGTTQQQLDNADFVFESFVQCSNATLCVCPLEFVHGPDVMHKGLVHSERSDARCLVESKIKLSDICVKTGLVSSKNEFRRKCEQKGLLYKDKPIENDFEIDVDVPDVFHTIRLGKRFLEVVIPLKEFKDDETETR